MAQATGGCDEDVGEVLTDAALERKGLGGRGRGVGGIGVVAHALVQAPEHEVQQVEHVVSGIVAALGGEIGDARIGIGERGLAQVEAGRKSLDGAAHHALGVARLDLALDQDGELAQRSLRGEDMGDVAEGVLVLVEPAIRGHVDAPARDVLTIVVARGQPQHLNHAAGGRLVAIAGEMRDANAHEPTTDDR